MKCSESGCDRPVSAKGKCRKHYARDWARAARGTSEEGLAKLALDKLRCVISEEEKTLVASLRASSCDKIICSEEEWSAVLAARNARCQSLRYARNKGKELLKRVRAKGWSEEATSAAWVRQGGLCEICRQPMVLGGRETHRDHYEVLDGVRVPPNTPGSTRLPRALLCRACNSMLGHYECAGGPRQAGLRLDGLEAYILRYGG